MFFCAQVAGQDYRVQTHAFLNGYHTTAGLPAAGLRKRLGELDRVLGGMEDAWYMDDEAEVDAMLPYAVELLRGLDVWGPTAQHIADATRSVAENSAVASNTTVWARWM